MTLNGNKSKKQITHCYTGTPDMLAMPTLRIVTMPGHILFRLVQGDFDPEITFQKVCVQYIEREIIIL